MTAESKTVLLTTVPEKTPARQAERRIKQAVERNVLLTIEYDGTNFSGWQRQPGARTVQGELEKALSRICGQDIRLNGASRTDAGVHALGQTASFKGDFRIPLDRIKGAVNNMLSGGKSANKCSDVRIVKVREVGEDFHARFDARGKKYRYLICNTGEPDIFRRNYFYQVKEPLDRDAMEKAAKYIEGVHDFAAFQSAGRDTKGSTVRTIFSAEVFKTGREVIAIEISGGGFLYNMVRIIAGTLIEAGMGRRAPESIEQVIKSRDRREAGPTAPSGGLYLVEVYYGEI